MDKTTKILKAIIKADGLMSLAANYYKTYPFEVRKQFVLEVKEQLIPCKRELIKYYGKEVVELLESYD